MKWLTLKIRGERKADLVEGVFFSSLLLFRKCVFTNLKLPFLMGFLPIERRYAHIKIEE